MTNNSDPLSITFSAMLKTFHTIIAGEPAAEKVKAKLTSLKQEASINNELNIRQKEAVIARCDNYINGDYGKTKIASNFGHSKSSSNGVAK